MKNRIRRKRLREVAKLGQARRLREGDCEFARAPCDAHTFENYLVLRAAASMLLGECFRRLAGAVILFSLGCVASGIVACAVANTPEREIIKLSNVCETNGVAGGSCEVEVGYLDGDGSGRMGRLRKFAQKESPELWRTIRLLEAEISDQDRRIESLRRSLETFGYEPREDADFVSICAKRNRMAAVRSSLWEKIEEAYWSSRRYVVVQNKKRHRRTIREKLDEGLFEAECVKRKFEDMMSVK